MIPGKFKELLGAASVTTPELRTQWAHGPENSANTTRNSSLVLPAVQAMPDVPGGFGLQTEHLEAVFHLRPSRSALSYK